MSEKDLLNEIVKIDSAEVNGKVYECGMTLKKEHDDDVMTSVFVYMNQKDAEDDSKFVMKKVVLEYDEIESIGFPSEFDILDVLAKKSKEYFNDYLKTV